MSSLCVGEIDKCLLTYSPKTLNTESACCGVKKSINGALIVLCWRASELLAKVANFGTLTASLHERGT